MRLKQAQGYPIAWEDMAQVRMSGWPWGFDVNARTFMCDEVRGELSRSSIAGVSSRWVQWEAIRFLILGALIWSSSLLGQPLQEGLAVPSDTKDPLCSVTGEALKYLSKGSQRMAGILERIARDADPMKDRFLNHQRAALWRAQLENAPPGANALGMRANMAIELLNAGESQQAIDAFESVMQANAQSTTGFNEHYQSNLRHYLALSYLRVGEQENCLTNHNTASCILPIELGGVHRQQRGSRRAIEILEEQLRRDPMDYKSAWLLNIAYMTLGEYPMKVPAKWRIPTKAFESDYDIHRFNDIAANLGVDTDDYAGGTIIEDFDLDGNLDILISDWAPRGAMHYFRNNGDGTFSDRTMEAGLTGLTGGLNLIQGDYNNDGLPDVLVLRGAWRFEAGNAPDSLLRNDGHGHFSDVTIEAGLLAYRPNQTVTWIDYNGDGWLDLYFGYESTADQIHPCQLFRNNHDGTFTDCAAAAGVAAVAYVKAVVTGDFNNDGKPDLYLSCRGQPNVLFRNDGPAGTNTQYDTAWKFTDVSVAAGVTEPISSFPAWFFDYDNDGWEDIMVTGYTLKDVGDLYLEAIGGTPTAEYPRLYRNLHNGTFQDVTTAAGLHHIIYAMGANFGDFDNDGWLDMYFGTGDPNFATLMPNKAYRNAGNGTFQDVTTSGGLGHLQKGHGVSFGDLNNDGTQDIYHSVGGAYEGDIYRNVLFENPGHGNHWLTLKLEGVKSNRIALGARIEVVVETEKGDRSIYRTVSTGGSFGANPLRQEIGLGQAKRVKKVEIFWPASGIRQTVDGIVMDHFFRIVEGDSRAKLMPLKSFAYSKVPPVGGLHGHSKP